MKSEVDPVKAEIGELEIGDWRLAADSKVRTEVVPTAITLPPDCFV
jgi:hypothetical protein